MKIRSLDDIKFDTDKQLYNLFVPQLATINDIPLFSYEVQKQEDMRIDLVMMSMYNDPSTLENMDIIFYINNIDNPLNIVEGMVLFYPDPKDFDTYRIYLSDKSSVGQDIKQQLVVPNKTTRKDDSRKKYIDQGYSLPPVVLDKSQPPVRLQDGKILIGGLNS